MITLWLNQKVFKEPFFTLKILAGQFPKTLNLKNLKPGITVNTDDLEEAFYLCQNLDYAATNYDWLIRGSRDRSASVGDFIFLKAFIQTIRINNINNADTYILTKESC